MDKYCNTLPNVEALSLASASAEIEKVVKHNLIMHGRDAAESCLE